MARSPKTPKASRDSLAGKIHEIRRSLAIYRVNASPYFRARMWVASQGKIHRQIHQGEHEGGCGRSGGSDVRGSPLQESYRSHPKEPYLRKLCREAGDETGELAEQGQIDRQHAKNDEYILKLDDGLISYFG